MQGPIPVFLALKLVGEEPQRGKPLDRALYGPLRETKAPLCQLLANLLIGKAVFVLWQEPKHFQLPAEF
jgi:hypothetical protein